MKKFIYIIFLLNIITLTAHGQLRFGSKKSTNVDINYENPQDFYIGGITVTGVQFLDPEAIIALTGLKIGDKITVPGDEISNAIKKLWDQGLIGDVEVVIKKIEGRTIFLEFILKERPRLSRFIFEGATKSEREDLEDKIDLSRGRIVNDALIKNTKNKIREFYLEKGYLNVTVDMVQIKDTLLENNIIIKVLIDKHEKVRVNKVIITGNKDLDSRILLTKLKKTKGKKATNLWTGTKIIRKTYEEEKLALIEYYNSKGYRDAAITSDSIYSIKESLVNINITIDEGKKYYFRNITWKGNYIYRDGQLDTILAIKKGDVYNYEQLQRKLSFNPTGADISSLYLDNGYLFFSVDPIEVLVEGDSIDIEMRIYEGEQATVNRVEVDGNTKTHDHVILREVRTYPGDKFSRSDLIRSQRELAALNYFDNEKLGMNPVPNPSTGLVDIGYSVTEKPNDQIELSGGWGGVFGFVGTVGLVFNNFSLRNIKHPKTWSPLPSGDGQRLAFRVQANGRSFQTYTVSFTEPWLGGKKPTSLSVSLQHSVQSTLDYSVRPPKRIGSLQVSGVTVTIGKRVKWPDDFFTVSHSFSMLRYTLDNYNFRNSAATLGFVTGYANNLSYNLTIARNNINDFQFPTSGANMSLSMTFTPPYSMFNGLDYSDPELDPKVRYKWVEYQKYIFDASWFTTLWKGSGVNSKHKIVFNTRFHVGVIGSYQPNVGIGPFERYIMGGDGLSGYNFLLGSDIIGLRGYLNNTINSGNPTGGVAFDKFVAEVRYPISNSPSFSIFVLSFFEAGNVWGDIKEVNPFEVYRSAGFGARIFMPAFGLIGIDWGVPFDEVPGLPNPNHKPHITFTIGQQIR